MLIVGVAFFQVVLAVHIMAVVVGFGVTFAYPLFAVIGERLDPRAMPWYHGVQRAIGQRLITPGLAVVLVAGIYLASDLHQWSRFYVQWGLAVAVVLGGLGGVFFAPSERRLAELADRDVAAAAAGTEVVWSQEYLTTRRNNAVVGSLSSLLVLVTIYLMTVQN